MKLMSMFLLIMLAAWGNLSSVLSSPPPPPSPTENAQEKQNISSAKNQESEQAKSQTQMPTTSVNQASATPTGQNTQTQSAKNRGVAAIKWSRINTGLLTVFNLLLVGVGILQWLSMRKQAEHMRDALGITQQSADTATDALILAKDASVLTTKIERAVVLVESVVAEPHGGTDSDYLLPSSLLVFSLKNYGATVAYKVKVECKITFEDKSFELNGDPGATIAPQGTNKWITYSLIAKLKKEEIERATRGNNLLTYVIDIAYDDAFGKHHTYRDVGSFISPLRGFITGGSESD